MSCVQGQGLKEVDMLVWMGDFNYRIDATYEHAKELAHRNQLTELLAKVAHRSCTTIHSRASGLQLTAA